MGTNISQKKRSIEPHVNAAVINTSILANEILFAQTENNVKGGGNVNGNLIGVFRMMQNVIASSTKILWTTVRASYVARHIFAQILQLKKSLNVAVIGNSLPMPRRKQESLRIQQSTKTVC